MLQARATHHAGAMDIIIVALGAIGAWLLVAGPVLQAALELREQEVDRDGIDAVTASVSPPPKLSPWWWLLPPVAYVRQRRANEKYREAVMEALTPAQREQTLRFLNKANGWLTVAAGASLIAIKETWEVIELLHWPSWVFWMLVVVAPLVCVGNTVLTMARTQQVLKAEAATTGTV